MHSLLRLVDVRSVPHAELALDLAIFDGIDRYLAERGAMLPPDERELLQRWSGIPIQPYEAAQVHRARR